MKKSSLMTSTRCLCVLLLTITTGCATSKTVNVAPKVSMDPIGIPVPEVMEYVIGPADVLSIGVWNQENMNKTVTVRPDGIITYPLIGEVYVVGMTPSQLQEKLEQELKEYINVLEGEVSVDINEVHSYKISVLGRVNTPGRFEFQSQATVLDALAEAGGLTDFASGSEILVLRPTPQLIRRISFNYEDFFQPDNNDGLLFIFPGDIVLVP